MAGDCRSLSEPPYPARDMSTRGVRTIKEFTTALKAVTEQDQTIEFSIDGHQLTAYQPTDGQLAILLSTIGRHTTVQTKIAGIIDFFVAVMDDDSASYVTDRLLSRTDPLEIDQVQEIMEWMVEEWTGRPTQSLSVSTQ